MQIEFDLVSLYLPCDQSGRGNIECMQIIGIDMIIVLSTHRREAEFDSVIDKGREKAGYHHQR